MNKKGYGIIAGILGGLGAAAFAGKKSQQNSADKVHAKIIEKIHDEFAKEGNIQGTWLDKDIDVLVDDEAETEYAVYDGGVSLRVNGELVQYSLIIDAKTFEILDKEKIL
jgi:predicted small secreted protein